MLLVWVLTSARFSASKAETVRKRTAPAVILALALAMAWPVARDLRDTLANRPDEPWQVAVGLHKMKISPGARVGAIGTGDRKSTRLNSSHGYISYAVFCLQKKTSHHRHTRRVH